MSGEMIAKLYGMKIEQVGVISYDPAMGIKAFVQRPEMCGNHHDIDTYGCQQHVPLLSIEFPMEKK